MPGGRPLKFSSPEELQVKIDEYFNTRKEDDPVTITGLAIHLDTFRETLCHYEERDKFSDTIKKAKQRVENAYEKRLVKYGRSGDIFALKNFDWRDKNETEFSGGLTLNKGFTEALNDIDGATKGISDLSALKDEE